MRENPLRYFYLSIAIIDIFLSQFSGQSASASASEFGLEFHGIHLSFIFIQYQMH